MERVDDRAQAELESQIYKRQDHLLSLYQRLRGQVDRRRARFTGRAHKVQRNTIQLLIGGGIGLALAFVSAIVRNVRRRRAARAVGAGTAAVAGRYQRIPAGYGHRLAAEDDHAWAAPPGIQENR